MVDMFEMTEMIERVEGKTMCEVTVLLDSVDKVRDFVASVSRYSAGMDLVSGRRVVDAKSIMSIFCADLSKPLTLRIHEEQERAEEIVSAIGQYVLERV